MALRRFIEYPGWLTDLRMVVEGGAPNQATLDGATTRLRDAIQVQTPKKPAGRHRA